MSEDLRYPVGRLVQVERLSAADREEAFGVLEVAPARLRVAVSGLNDAQLNTPYRDGGWTVRQVVHHVADSHMNAYLRVRWTLTEDTPTIKPYLEKLWAELPDGRTGPVAESLALLEGVHGRFLRLLRALDESDFQRRFVHPEGWTGSIDTIVATYAWHSRHHVAHITKLRERMGW